MNKVQLPLLDCVVCDACELRCVACTNGIGMLEHLRIYPADEVKRDLDLAATVMHTEVLVILGGESLLHKQLVPLMRYAKASGIADRVRVLTNGVRLHKMSGEFWDELEDLRVSIYPGKTPSENVELARAMQKQHGFELSFYDVAADPFRAVLTKQARTPEDAARTFLECWYRSNTRKIQQGYFWRCCTSPSISRTVLGLQPDEDGLRLDGVTVERLEEFLARGEPMASCYRCHGNLGPRLAEWSEERDRSRWMEASAV